MNIKKYFWGLNPRAIKETERIIRAPHNPRFAERMFVFLSRCDKPRELFSIISKEKFIKSWPKIRRFWIKRRQAEDFRAWWETVYEKLIETQGVKRITKGPPSKIFKQIGDSIRTKRIENGLSQKDLAGRTGLKQPDISKIEQGKINITLETLIKLCKILDIKNISLS